MSLKDEFNKSFEPVKSDDGFDICLFRLIRRADKDNLEAFATVFPKHYKIYDAWKRFGVEYTNNELMAG